MSAIPIYREFSYEALRFQIDPEAQAPIPEGALVTRATLTLQLARRCDAGTEVILRRLPISWDPETATWNCASVVSATTGCGSGMAWGDLDSYEQVGSFTCPSAPLADAVSIDVTSDIAEWAASPGAPHHGWVVSVPEGRVRAHALESTFFPPTLHVSYSTDGVHVPDEPVAPPLDRAAVSNVYDSYRFLYDPAASPGGAQNPQLGVAPSAIDPDRAAHLRGRVLDASALVEDSESDPALPGTSVEVRGLPAYGRAYTRASGVWDMVINGGGPVTLVFRRPGYLEVHRNVDVTWGDDLLVEDVVMTPEPTRCTPALPGSASGFFQGTDDCAGGTCVAANDNGWTTADERGTRSIGVYMPAGVSPTIGAEHTPPGYRICMREYTRSPEGADAPTREAAMPADVAANTAYTFAAEGQVRLAAPGSTQRGVLAEEAVFSDDIFVYVRSDLWSSEDEDLDFPYGTAIPLGTFSRERSAWEPGYDGVVVEVHCPTAGDPTAQPEDLVPLEELVALCTSGMMNDVPTARFWRVPVRHFSPYDLNLLAAAPVPGGGSGGGSGSGSGAGGSGGGDGGGHGDDSQCEAAGSVIHCEGRAVAEMVPITGTDTALVYHSAHHRGRRELYRVRVQPVGLESELSMVTPSMTAESEVSVAGRVIGTVSFTNAQLLARTPQDVIWDGIDAFGRPVQGPRFAQIRTTYTLRTPFCGQDSGGSGVVRRFGLRSASLECAPTGDGIIRTVRDERVLVGTVDDSRRGLGGWMLAAQHTYDPATRLLYYGTGGRRSIQTVGATASRLVALADVVPGLDPAQAFVGGMAHAPDGTLYFTLRGGSSFYAPEPWEGLFRLALGASAPVQVANDLGHPLGVTVARDGSVWVSGGEQRCARRYDPSTAPPWSGEVVLGACADGTSFPAPLPTGGVPPVGVLDDPLALRVLDLRWMAAAADGSVWFGASDSSSTTGLYRWRPDGVDGVVDLLAGQYFDIATGSSAGQGIEVFAMRPTTGGSMLIDGWFWDGESGFREVRIFGSDGASGPYIGERSSATPAAYDVVDRSALVMGSGGSTRGALGADASGRAFFAMPGLSSVPGETSDMRIVRTAGGQVETFAGAPAGDDLVTDDVCTLTQPDERGRPRAAPARRVRLGRLDSFTTRPSGGVVAAIRCLDEPVLFVIDSPFEGSIEVAHEVVSEDRSVLYQFDAVGRHLRTRDVLTGHVLASFVYDDAGRLVRYVDRESAVTSIEHVEGEIRVTAPGGLVTTIRLAPTTEPGTDYAEAIVAPDGREWTLHHDATALRLGLLDSFQAPGEVGAHVFLYDALGRLEYDHDLRDDPTSPVPVQRLLESPETETVTLESVLLGTPQEVARQVTLRSAEGRERRYAMQRRGGTTWSRVDLPRPTGGEAVFAESLDLGTARGRRQARTFDGTLALSEQSADPFFDTQAAYTSSLHVCRPSEQDSPSVCTSGQGVQLTTTRSLVGASTFEEATSVAGDTWTLRHDSGLRMRTITAPNGRTVTMRLDAQGRVRRIEPPDQYPICIAYEGHRVASVRQGRYPSCAAADPAERRLASFGYGTTGRRWLEDVSVGHGSATLTTDLTPIPTRGLVNEVLLPGRTETASFRYDGEGRVTGIEPAGHVASTDYRYSYNGRGMFDTESTPPVPGRPRSPAETSDTQYTPDGHLASQSYRGLVEVTVPIRDGQTGYARRVQLGSDRLDITPDGLGRPESIVWSGGATGNFGYQYDGALLEQEVQDLPSTDRDATLTRAVSYREGVLTSTETIEDESAGGQNISTALTYVATPSAPFDGASPFLVATASRGDLTSSVGLALVGQPSVTPSDTSTHYLARADVTGVPTPLETWHGANAWGETSDLLTRSQTSTLDRQTWYRDQICQRDPQGRILRRFETYREPGGPSGTRLRYLRWEYAYDAQGRLSLTRIFRHTTGVSCTTVSGGTPVLGSSAFTYDVNTGNRSFTGSSYGNDDQLLRENGRRYEYDGRGRTTVVRDAAGATIASYGWDTLGHLRSSTASGATTSYQFDPSGRLIAIRTGTPAEDQFFVYRDGLEPVAWSRGEVHQYYVYGTQPHVPDLIYEDSDDADGIDAVYRVITDERGSVRSVLRVDDPEGISVAQQIEYDAWGAPRFVVGTETTQPFGFAGATWLGSARLWHMGAREYDPRLGRWLTKDPIRFAGGTNLYVYCENDPVNYVDPHGLNSIVGKVVAVVGYVAGAMILGGSISGAMSYMGAVATSASAADRGDAFVSGFAGGMLGTLTFMVAERFAGETWAGGAAGCVSAGTSEVARQALGQMRTGAEGSWGRVAASAATGAVLGFAAGPLVERAAPAVEGTAGQAILVETLVSGWGSGIIASYDLAVEMGAR